MDTTLNQNKGGYQGTGQTGNFNGVQYNAPTSVTPYGSVTMPTSTSVPTTIPGSAITSNPQPYTVPNTNPQSAKDALTASVTALVPQINSDQVKDTTAETNVDTSNNDLVTLMKSLGAETTDTNDAEVAQGIPQMNKDLTDLQTLQTQQLGTYLNRVNQGERAGISAPSSGAVEAEASRQHGIDALITSSLIQAKQGSIQAAQATVDRAIAAKYDPIKNAIAVQNTIIQNNRDNLSRADKKLADDKLEQNNLKLKQIDMQAQDEKDINSVILEAAKNGAPNSVLALMKNATSVNDAIAQSNGFIEDKVAKAIQNQQLLKLQIENRQALGLPVGNGNSNNSGLINTILASGKFTKDQASAIKTAVSQGQDPLTVVKNQAKNIMGTSEATNLTKLEVARDTLTDIGTQLAQFYAAGGDTGIFKGNFEKAINNLGKVNDPNLVALATQIQGNLQIYRNAISGTAYSEQEGKDISSIFPGINKSQDLNNAILKGRSTMFDSVIDSTYKTALGSAYTDLKNANSLGPKGNQDDKTFVSKSLTNQGINYNDFVSKVPSGHIPVIENSSGQAGYITPEEFTNTKYTKI